MIGRNKLTITLVVMMIAGFSVATLVTVKDHDLILNQFEEFWEDPFSWDGIQNEGILHLYIEGDVSENSTGSDVLILESVPPQYQIMHLYLTINKIEIKLKNQNSFRILFATPRTIDLKDLNNTLDLFDSFSIPEGNYSSLRLHYDNEIIAETDQGNKTFTSQGSDLLSIPLYRNRINRTDSELQIRKNRDSNLLLSLNMQIRWQQQIIFPHIFGYLEF
ncbi:MAG: DUF4382 domain-containing protein [Candidatus Heimdallarchaeaceae archaeon]|jgi:hypothetical protein